MNWKKYLVIAVLCLICFAIGLRHRQPILSTPVVVHTEGGTTTTEPLVNPSDQLMQVLASQHATNAELAQAKSTIESLTKENKNLHVKLSELSYTLATVKSSHEGTATTIAPAPASAPAAPATFDFKDWQLHFTLSGLQAHYDLTQQFVVVHSTGRNAAGAAVSNARVYQVGPKGERVPVPNVVTTAVAFDDTKSHLFVDPSLQAGVGVELGSAITKGGFVGMQWWRLGRTHAAEDSSLGFLSPMVFITKGKVIAGIAPVNWNLGTLPYQPFKDLWVTPVLGYDGKLHYLLALVASF